MYGSNFCLCNWIFNRKRSIKRRFYLKKKFIIKYPYCDEKIEIKVKWNDFYDKKPQLMSANFYSLCSPIERYSCDCGKSFCYQSVVNFIDKVEFLLFVEKVETTRTTIRYE